MKDLYRKKANTDIKELSFQIIEWFAHDEIDEISENDECQRCDYECECEESNYIIRCFGSTEDGKTVSCKITGFKPFYYIKVYKNFDEIKKNALLSYIETHYLLKKIKDPVCRKLCKIVEKKDIYGFNNGRLFKYVKLVFNNLKSFQKSKYIFKKPVKIPQIHKDSIKYKLYESNFEPFLRFCHINNIKTCGWVNTSQIVHIKESKTQYDIQVNHTMIKPMNKQTIANFLQASWDIEVYSYDYSFPDPKLRIIQKNKEIFPNEIFQIATTFKYVKTNEIIKHIFTLKKSNPVQGIIIEECINELDLIQRWVKLIETTDPDILYTYNGDCFDASYLYKRSELYGIENKILLQFSRLYSVPSVMKVETFSSSAYGDSDFHRLYIIGRLNYDLLIHYKRGMKKYPSYKLEYIANEILKEGKHDVSAKDIFNLYKRGTMEDIEKILKYCVQDTVLLQKLVDKQLVLTNIIQLANVTYVPISYLTTRGQTIKVYSQILRKARQMNFLVPHTNFNEDNYPLQVKLYEKFHFDKFDIGDLITIELWIQKDNKPKKTTVSGKVSSLDFDKLVVNLDSDTEITKDYYNLVIKLINKGYECKLKKLSIIDDDIQESFTGASVLEPKCGFYNTDNIAILDFASLYPTIMISRNLCYSSFVLEDIYRNIDGVNYERITWKDSVEFKLNHTCDGVGKTGKSAGKVCGKQAFFEVDKQYYCRIHDPLKKQRSKDEKFEKKQMEYDYTIVQPTLSESGELINEGVLPALLKELYNERKLVKKQMFIAEKQGNVLLSEILDSTQLAIKISLNSCYGFLGRAQGSLILKELGSIVTAVNNHLIKYREKMHELVLGLPKTEQKESDVETK
jgi:DNA polymerase elongation subunit (family B)